MSYNVYFATRILLLKMVSDVPSAGDYISYRQQVERFYTIQPPAGRYVGSTLDRASVRSFQNSPSARDVTNATI